MPSRPRHRCRRLRRSRGITVTIRGVIIPMSRPAAAAGIRFRRSHPTQHPRNRSNTGKTLPSKATALHPPIRPAIPFNSPLRRASSLRPATPAGSLFRCAHRIPNAFSKQPSNSVIDTLAIPTPGTPRRLFQARPRETPSLRRRGPPGGSRIPAIRRKSTASFRRPRRSRHRRRRRPCPPGAAEAD